jgi:hypothetical protein
MPARIASGVLRRGKTGYEAFDRDQQSLGMFTSQMDAANAIDAGANYDK